MSLVVIPKDTHQGTWPVSLSISVVLTLSNAGKVLILFKGHLMAWTPQPYNYFYCYFLTVILWLLQIIKQIYVFSDGLWRPLKRFWHRGWKLLLYMQSLGFILCILLSNLEVGSAWMTHSTRRWDRTKRLLVWLYWYQKTIESTLIWSSPDGPYFWSCEKEERNLRLAQLSFARDSRC